MEATSFRKHLLQNLLLLFLSLAILPFTTPVCFYFYVRARRSKPPTIPNSHHKTILITSPYMTKSLHLIRTLSSAGHRIITASTTRLIPTPGALSLHTHKSFTIAPPTSPISCQTYSSAILSLALREKICAWIPVSSVVSATADATAATLLHSRIPNFRTLIPSPETVSTLDDKASFIAACQNLHLDVPETLAISDLESAVDFLHDPARQKQFIVKCTSTHDAARGDLTTLPLARRELTSDFVAGKMSQVGRTLEWVLQEFIPPPAKEYATHCIVTQGKIRSFVVVDGGEMVMRYRPVMDAGLVREMREWTEGLLEGLGVREGQVSMDFLVEGTKGKAKRRVVGIECNPRTHTAVVSMRPEAIVRGCESLFEEEEEEVKVNGFVNGNGNANGHANGNGKAKVGAMSYANVVANGGSDNGSDYDSRGNGRAKELQKEKDSEELADALPGEKWWVAHELLTNPLGLLKGTDAEFDPNDPLPWWWAYHVWWPSVFVESLWTGKRWTRINVSTGKVFQSA